MLRGDEHIKYFTEAALAMYFSGRRVHCFMKSLDRVEAAKQGFFKNKKIRGTKKLFFLSSFE